MASPTVFTLLYNLSTPLRSIPTIRATWQTHFDGLFYSPDFLLFTPSSEATPHQMADTTNSWMKTSRFHTSLLSSLMLKSSVLNSHAHLWEALFVILIYIIYYILYNGDGKWWIVHALKAFKTWRQEAIAKEHCLSMQMTWSTVPSYEVEV